MILTFSQRFWWLLKLIATSGSDIYQKSKQAVTSRWNKRKYIWTSDWSLLTLQQQTCDYLWGRVRRTHASLVNYLAKLLAENIIPSLVCDRKIPSIGAMILITIVKISLVKASGRLSKVTLSPDGEMRIKFSWKSGNLFLIQIIRKNHLSSYTFMIWIFHPYRFSTIRLTALIFPSRWRNLYNLFW